MVKKSARLLGKMVLKTAREMNELLKNEGYLEGDPGAYKLTEKGKKYGKESEGENGNASWSFKVWDEEIVNEISGVNVIKEDRFPGIDWYCDKCGAFLSVQFGFNDHESTWKCTECGYKNSISASDIRR